MSMLRTIRWWMIEHLAWGDAIVLNVSIINGELIARSRSLLVRDAVIDWTDRHQRPKLAGSPDAVSGGEDGGDRALALDVPTN